MNSETIVMCVVALLLGMLMANMLKNVCGCNKVVEGQPVPPGLFECEDIPDINKQCNSPLMNLQRQSADCCDEGSVCGEAITDLIGSHNLETLCKDERGILHKFNECCNNNNNNIIEGNDPKLSRCDLMHTALCWDILRQDGPCGPCNHLRNVGYWHDSNEVRQCLFETTCNQP